MITMMMMITMNDDLITMMISMMNNNNDEDVKEGVEEDVYFSPLSSYGQSQIGIIARPWEIATDQGGSAY